MTQQKPILDDNAIALQARAGDADAFHKLMNQHRNWVFGKAVSMLQDYHAAEDAVQDVFIKVWQNLGKWDADKGNFAAWLNTVARNVIIDVQRQRLRIPTSVAFEEEPLTASLIDTRPGPSRLAEMREAQTILEHALTQVTKPNHRIAWILRYLEGYSIRETARILLAKEGTVKIWTLRCNEELRAILVRKNAWHTEV